MSKLISSLNGIMFDNRNIKWIRFWYVCYLYAWIYLNINVTSHNRPLIKPIIRYLIGAIIGALIRKWN